ncbi:MAG: NAD-binding protein [Sandaracinaceae bacterium]
MRTSVRGWIWRGGVMLVALSLGFVAFRMGVGVSDRQGIVGASIPTHVYYTIGLFVLGGMDLGVPVGGPVIGRAMLWTAYFLAPSITVSAVLEALVRVLRPQLLRARAPRDHIVIVGLGRLGLLFLEALREREPNTEVWVLERDAGAPNLEIARTRYHVNVLLGDVRAHATFSTLGLDGARGLALLTDNDLVNLEIAWRIADLHPKVPVFTHVADIGMRRLMGETQVDRPQLHVFNSHEIAAQRLYREHLVHIFCATGPKDVVVLAGFGRFGQSIFEYLSRETEGELQRAILVDVAAARQRRMFDAQVHGTKDFDIVCVDGDLDDPKTWEAVEGAAHGLEVEPVYVIGTDDDQRNLRTAIALRRLHRKAPIFVRCVFPSAFTARLSSELDITVLAVESMLREALRERIDRWT